MTKPVTILLLLLATAILSLILLRTATEQKQLPLGFERKTSSQKLMKSLELDLPGGRHNIIGFYEGKIFLSTTQISKLFIVDVLTGHTSERKINLPTLLATVSDFEMNLYYPYLYISATNERKILRADLTSGFYETFDIRSGPLLSTAIVDTNRAIIRTLDTAIGQMQFSVVDLVSGHQLQTFPIGNRGPSDLFINDGKLCYDSASQLLAYVPFYNNRVTLFDTALSQFKINQTVDTITEASTSVAYLHSSLTFEQPPRMVNSYATLRDNKLYIQSTLMAANESLDHFNNNSVIDFYKNGYLGSLYLPIHPRDLKSFFLIDNNSIVATTQKKLIVFKIM